VIWLEVSSAVSLKIYANTPEDMIVRDYAILLPGQQEPIIKDSLPELSLQQTAMICERVLVPFTNLSGTSRTSKGTLIQVNCRDTKKQGAFRITGNRGLAKTSVIGGGTASSTKVLGGGTDLLYAISGYVCCTNTQALTSSCWLRGVYQLAGVAHTVNYNPANITNQCKNIN